MAWETTHQTIARDRLGRAVIVKLERDLPAAPASVDPLPIIADGGVRIPWTFSDDLGFGYLTYSLALDLVDQAGANAPDGLAAFLESVDPSELRASVTVAGTGPGKLFEGPAAFATIRRGLWKGRRRIRAAFASSTVRSGPVRPDAAIDVGGRALASDLIEASLTDQELVASNVWYAHPWRSQAVWPEQAPLSWLHQLYVPWRRVHAASTWTELAEALCRVGCLRIGRSLTQQELLVAEVTQGWDGAVSMVPTNEYESYLPVPVPTVDAVELSGTWGSERVSRTSVRTGVEPEGDDLPGQVRDRLGLVADAPAEIGADVAGSRAIDIVPPYTSEPGTSVSGIDGERFAQALTVLRASGGSYRAVGQVYGLTTSDADACLQLETAIAHTLHGWLSPSRRRANVVLRDLVDPMLPFAATLPEDVERTWLGVEGAWDVLGVRTEASVIELSGPAEAAPTSPAAWHDVTQEGPATVVFGWTRYTVVPLANRRLSTLTLSVEWLDGGSWQPATFRRPGGSAIASLDLSDVVTWDVLDPEGLSIELEDSSYAGESVRWVLSRGGSVVATSAPVAVPV